MDYSTPGLPVHHQLPELTQTHVHWVGEAIQPSHPLLPPCPALNLSQHEGLFRWFGSSHHVAKFCSFSISPSNEYSGLTYAIYLSQFNIWTHLTTLWMANFSWKCWLSGTPMWQTSAGLRKSCPPLFCHILPASAMVSPAQAKVQVPFVSTLALLLFLPQASCSHFYTCFATVGT